MLEDVVIDTNVLMHAQNPRESRFDDANTLVQQVIDGTVFLCVDEGFSLDPARNSSAILTEYLQNIIAGSTSYALVVKLVKEKRIKEIGRAEYRIVRRINQLIRNTIDRKFLCVAYGSNNKIMVTHDYTDFQKRKRRDLLREFHINLIEAGDCCSLLS